MRHQLKNSAGPRDLDPGPFCPTIGGDSFMDVREYFSPNFKLLWSSVLDLQTWMWQTNTQTSSSILWFPWGGSHNNLDCVINRVGSITFKMYFNYKIQITFLKSNSNIFSITLALAKYKIHFLKVIKIQNNKVSVIAVRQLGICLTSVCSVHRA